MFRQMLRSVPQSARLAGALLVLLLIGAGLAWRMRAAPPAPQAEAAREICVSMRHPIQPGETLSGIAELYGIPLAELRRQNDFLAGEDAIYAGQVLSILNCSSAPLPTVPVQPLRDGELLYEVDSGDTCASIAGLFNIPESVLIAANGLPAACDRLWVGQMLRIPLATTTAPAGADTAGAAPELAERISLAQAESLVRAAILARKPGMNPTARFPLSEKTGDETWQRMRVQVYQVTEGVQQYQTYVIADGRVIPIGEGFGGMGVHTQLVTDLDQDGAPELVFAYSFGSGLHQSGVGILYPTADGYASMPAANFRYQGDLTLERLDDATVRVNPRGAGPPLGSLRLREGQLVVTN